MSALRLTDGPLIPSTHAPRPVVYRAERVPVGRRLWWPDVPEACPVCRGRLIEDGDRVVCLTCSRETHEVQERRPKPVPRGLFGGEPRRGRPPKPVAKDASMCREPACTSPREAGRSLCSKHRTDRYRERVLESGRGCARPGCDEPVHVFGATTRYCRAHNSEHRRALRQGRAS